MRSVFGHLKHIKSFHFCKSLIYAVSQQIPSQSAKFSQPDSPLKSHRSQKNFVRENVSSCSLCQVENERFSRNCLSKSENLSNRTDLKTNFLKSLKEFGSIKKRKLVKTETLKTKIPKISQAARLCRTPKKLSSRSKSQF